MVEETAFAREVVPLAGTLPEPCQRDIDVLRRFVRGTVSQAMAPTDAVSPADFREVFLTGATGFVGRFVLGDLLRSSGDLLVHCLVRADDPEHGLARLQKAMQAAGTWEPAFASRIRPVPGDITVARFGVNETGFQALCRRVDAVYHFAAELGLSSSYASLLKVNTFSISSVLELCLRERFKHLFFASTMGVFPEYFCVFANEFRDSRIDHQAQPDPVHMKRLFPLGMLGYPWSKLVTEQVLLLAQRTGMPLAIFRLPQTGVASTGMTQMNDVLVRLASAVADVQMIPQGFTKQRGSEAVDTLSRVCTAISLNPRRRFTIYHCCDPAPVFHDLEPADLGFYWPVVTYTEFKRVCQGRGERSPLHNHWSILDHLARYWFSDSRAVRDIPVCDHAIREDCPEPISWPGTIAMLTKSGDWIRRQPGWPYRIPQGRLDFDSLVDRAGCLAERAGVPFEQTYPEWLRDRLEHLVQALDAPQARLLESRRGLAVYGLNHFLRNNAALASERQRFPEIVQEAVMRPVFIVGINRSGTTFLHRLMARDPRFRTLRFYEMVFPTLDSDQYAGMAGTPEDPRRARVEDLIDASGAAGTFAGIHPIDKDEPEEDLPLLGMSFSSWLPTVQYHLPDYARWLDAASFRQAYLQHRRTMQHYVWQCRRRGMAPGQWLFKMPFHLMELEALINAYPDALFIQTHRDPAQVMGSWNSLVERIRSATIEPRSSVQTGEEQLAFMSGMLNRGVQFRMAWPEIEDRWVDVDYADLVRDPVSAVRGIYERFDWMLDRDAEDEMNAWLVRQAERRRRETRHSYHLEDYGLDRQKVRAAFSAYLDFMGA